LPSYKFILRLITPPTYFIKEIATNTSMPSQQYITMSSSLTIHLEQLQYRFPVVSDKAIIDLVNGIQVSQHIFRYRKNRGWLGNLIDKLDGSDSERRLLLDGNLIAGQEALYNWVEELVDKLTITQSALTVTQNSLLSARDAISHLGQIAQAQEGKLLEFSERLNSLAKQVSMCISNFEERVRLVEVKVSASQDLDKIVTAWAAKQTYTEIPWILQVALLAREVFSSSVVMYELETNDIKYYRQLLVNKILDKSEQLPSSGDSLNDLLDTSLKDIQNDDDLELLAGLLEVRSYPMQRLVNLPHLFVIGTTMELATLPVDARPLQPGKSAFALCRAHIDTIDRTTDASKFVTAVVEETANDYLALLANKITLETST
jgi:YjcZ-like protein